MKVTWTRPASQDAREFYEQIYQTSWDAAANIQKHIRQRTRQLADFPFSGRVGPVPGTREIVLSPWPYIAVYRVVGDCVEILAVRHGARQWPPAL